MEAGNGFRCQEFTCSNSLLKSKRLSRKDVEDGMEKDEDLVI